MNKMRLSWPVIEHKFLYLSVFGEMTDLEYEVDEWFYEARTDSPIWDYNNKFAKYDLYREYWPSNWSEI